LANYKIPRRVEFSPDDLPQSGSGTIIKRTLRERFWTHRKKGACVEFVVAAADSVAL
jgi:acyl-CoA synthetase (AMP-forming)/AMP-acid ligase II